MVITCTAVIWGCCVRIIVVGIACLLIAVAPGCSVHPLPGDITRDTTFAIIHNIRCEARAEVKDHLQALLLRSPSVLVQSIDPEDALENLEKVRAHDPESASTIKRYSLSAIAYLFTFDITENDDATKGSAHFALPWNHGKFTLDLTGELTKERIGSRKIGVVETFEELDQLDCSEASQQRRNLVYPITGSIGMAETVDSFFRLAESVGDNKKFSDTLIPLALSSDAIHDPWIGRERCQASGLGDEALPGGSDRGLDGVVVCEKAVGEEALLQEQPQPLDRIELG